MNRHDIMLGSSTRVVVGVVSPIGRCVTLRLPVGLGKRRLLCLRAIALQLRLIYASQGIFAHSVPHLFAAHRQMCGRYTLCLNMGYLGL